MNKFQQRKKNWFLFATPQKKLLKCLILWKKLLKEL